MKQEEKAFTFRVPVAVIEALQVYAEAHDLSVAQVVRRVLKQFIADTPTQKGGE